MVTLEVDTRRSIIRKYRILHEKYSLDYAQTRGPAIKGASTSLADAYDAVFSALRKRRIRTDSASRVAHQWTSTFRVTSVFPAAVNVK